MFNGLKRKWRSAEAAALIESTLDEMAKQGTFDGDAKQFGFKIIKGATDQNPAMFDGRNGHIPHRISFAAFALAMTAERALRDGQVFPVVMIALGMILQGAQAGAGTFPFSPQDIAMLDTATTTLMALDDEEDEVGIES